MRISVQEYPAAFAEPIVKISANALATLTRSMNDAFMASPSRRLLAMVLRARFDANVEVRLGHLGRY